MDGVTYIGVVDDDPHSRATVVAHLRRYEEEHGVEFSVRTFSDGAQLTRGYRADFDVLFLDVEMARMDGFETAHAVRALDDRVVIVFITRMAQMAIKGYEVDALSYLVKPVPYFAFSQELARSLQRVRRTQSEGVMLPVAGGTARVDVADIVYVESIKHRIVVHAIGRKYAFTGTLKAIEEQLAGQGFFRSNNCYLVNLRHVHAVRQSTSVMLGGDELQISRARKRAFLDAMADHLGGRVP